MGAGTHVVAVCQPCVQVLAAAAVMAEAGNPAQPRSMTLMAGPIDTRINPTKVNELASSKPIEWFEQQPDRPRAGALSRAAAAGSIRASCSSAAFMSMNIDRHRKAHLDLYEQLASGETEKAKATKAFYDEYFAVLDLAAEFYLETVQWVFQEARLAKGELTYRGERGRPARHPPHGAADGGGRARRHLRAGPDRGRARPVHGLKPYMSRHHMQAGVGHYGVFTGKRWEEQVYPMVRNMILSSE